MPTTGMQTLQLDLLWRAQRAPALRQARVSFGRVRGPRCRQQQRFDGTKVRPLALANRRIILLARPSGQKIRPRISLRKPESSSFARLAQTTKEMPAIQARVSRRSLRPDAR